MSKRPWLTIIGFGEDGIDGLPPASLAALEDAEIVMAPPRHLSLLPAGPREQIEWPVPYADGIARLLELRGRKVVVLASGDPFWFGAGSTLGRHLEPGEWHALPAPSAFSVAAACIGWPLEQVACLGLHAAPLSRLRPHLAEGARAIVLLRDGEAVGQLARYLEDTGFAGSKLTVCEALGGPRERIITINVADAQKGTFTHPVCVAIEVSGDGTPLPLASGRDDTFFDHDGQITKRPVRALTLSALAPCPGEHLWDIGGGSGSIAIEWLLAHPSLRATSIEADPERAVRIKENATRLGVDRLQIVEGRAPEALEGLDAPDVVFVGGGLSEALLDTLMALRAGTRVVANAVTLEAETLLAEAHETHGGTLLRIDLAEAAPLGRKRGWRASYPIVQWSVTL